MDLVALVEGVAIGFVSGGLAGFLGVSSGGMLVPLIALVLGVNQFVAQGASLIVQAVPVGLSGVRQYGAAGHGVPTRWLVVVSLGFLVGGVLGALGTGIVSDVALRWTFVAYLIVLLLLVVFGKKAPVGEGEPEGAGPSTFALAATGLAGGISSGFLGIGGGLAITAVGAGLLGIRQHKAQMIGLAISTLPLTAPAALVYLQSGRPMPWWAIAGMLPGLWLGTLLGAKAATRVAPERLRGIFALLLGVMAALMAAKAWTAP